MEICKECSKPFVRDPHSLDPEFCSYECCKDYYAWLADQAEPFDEYNLEYTEDEW